MKASLSLFLLSLTFFCSDIAAQNQATIHFDLRPGAKVPVTMTGATRARLAGNSNNSNTASAATLEQQIFAMINAERAKNGLVDLEWSESVATVARMHSADMAHEKFFGHRGSDGSMVDDRADRAGLGTWRTIGENIAYMRGFEDPAALAVEKWLESPAHRKNLLGPNWKESAVGVSVTADGTYYMTEVFLLRK